MMKKEEAPEKFILEDPLLLQEIATNSTYSSRNVISISSSIPQSILQTVQKLPLFSLILLEETLFSGNNNSLPARLGRTVFILECILTF